MDTDDTVTIYDVAREAGVSMATVNGIVNGNKNVKENTRKKCLRWLIVWITVQMPWRVVLQVKDNYCQCRDSKYHQWIYFSTLAKGIDDIAEMYKYNIVLANSDEGWW